MACTSCCEIVEWELTDIEEPQRITSPVRCDLPHPPFAIIESHIKVDQTPKPETSGCKEGCVCRPVGEREVVYKERVYRGYEMLRWNADYTESCLSTYWYTATLIKYRTKGECVPQKFERVER